MQWMKDALTMVRLKALKDTGLTSEDIMDLVRESGREAVLAMGAEELERQKEASAGD